MGIAPKRSYLRSILLLALLGAVALLWLLREPEAPLSAGARSSATRPTSTARWVAPASAPAGPIAIPIRDPVELDFLSRDQVFALRRAAVARQPGLIVGGYQPSPAVFQIEDRRPWWGIVGQFYHGRGQHSIEGPSEESRLIVNPYLLVAAEFLGLSPYRRGFGMWRWKQFKRGEILRADFPFVIKPHSLQYRLRARQVELRYPVTTHLIQLNRYTTRVFRLADATFELYTYNAQDLGFSHLRLDLARSKNVRKVGASASPLPLRHFLHRGGSCGYPGGCNNMSPNTPELNDFELLALPARLALSLWRRAPAAGDPPALRCTIYFE